MNKKIIFLALIFFVIITSFLLFFTNESKNELASQILHDCKHDSRCAIEFLQDESEFYDKETILDTIDELILVYSESENLCHQNAHHLGDFVYGYLGDVTESIEFVESTKCGGAVVHSIVKNHLDSQVLLYNFEPKQVDFLSICLDSFEYPTIDRWECLHGVGHGLASIYGYNMSNAVVACQQFEDWEQISCAKGLFMENVVRFNKSHDSDFDENDLSYPCSVIDDEITAPCYHYQPTYVGYSQPKLNNIVDYCETIEDEFSKNCFRGIGRLFASLVVSDINKINLVCDPQKFSYDKLTYCYQGVAMVFADNRNISEALDVCQFIPNEFQHDCVHEVGKWVKLVHPDFDDIQKQCSQLNSEELLKTCMDSKIYGISIL